MVASSSTILFSLRCIAVMSTQAYLWGFTAAYHRSPFLYHPTCSWPFETPKNFLSIRATFAYRGLVDHVLRLTSEFRCHTPCLEVTCTFDVHPGMDVHSRGCRVVILLNFVGGGSDENISWVFGQKMCFPHMISQTVSKWRHWKLDSNNSRHQIPLSPGGARRIPSVPFPIVCQLANRC